MVTEIRENTLYLQEAGIPREARTWSKAVVLENAFFPLAILGLIL